MSEADRKIFDDVMARQQAGLSAREKERPQVRMHSPGVSKGLNEAHHYLKYDSGFGDRLTTIAVLTTAGPGVVRRAEGIVGDLCKGAAVIWAARDCGSGGVDGIVCGDGL